MTMERLIGLCALVGAVVIIAAFFAVDSALW
jgi:hypothetical protein